MTLTQWFRDSPRRSRPRSRAARRVLARSAGNYTASVSLAGIARVAAGRLYWGVRWWPARKLRVRGYRDVQTALVEVDACIHYANTQLTYRRDLPALSCWHLWPGDREPAIFGDLAVPWVPHTFLAGIFLFILHSLNSIGIPNSIDKKTGQQVMCVSLRAIARFRSIHQPRWPL